MKQPISKLPFRRYKFRQDEFYVEDANSNYVFEELNLLEI